MKLTKRNRLLKFQYLQPRVDNCSSCWHEREETFFTDKAYKNLITVIENHLRFEGVNFEEVVNYSDIILNNFNRIALLKLLRIAGVESKVGYKLLEVVETTNIGKGAL
jgi:hypothetical protein